MALDCARSFSGRTVCGLALPKVKHDGQPRMALRHLGGFHRRRGWVLAPDLPDHIRHRPPRSHRQAWISQSTRSHHTVAMVGTFRHAQVVH